MTVTFQNDENISLENTVRINRYGAEDAGSLTPLLRAYRVKMINDIGDEIKVEANKLLKAENNLEFSRKLKIVIQKNYDPVKKQLILPPDVLEMLQQMNGNDEFVTIMEEVGFVAGKSVYTEAEKVALSENMTPVQQLLGKKLEHVQAKMMELNTYRMDIMQLVNAPAKEESEIKKRITHKAEGK